MYSTVHHDFITSFDCTSNWTLTCVVGALNPIHVQGQQPEAQPSAQTVLS